MIVFTYITRIQMAASPGPSRSPLGLQLSRGCVIQMIEVTEPVSLDH